MVNNKIFETIEKLKTEEFEDTQDAIAEAINKIDNVCEALYKIPNEKIKNFLLNKLEKIGNDLSDYRIK